jgi:hypothetical protein
MTVWRSRQGDKQQSYSKRVTILGYIKAITRLVDNIKMFLTGRGYGDEDWIYLIQNMDRWWAH